MAADGVRALWERGQARYPDLPLPLDAFAAYLAARLPDEAGDPARVPAEDLYLVAACLAGVEGAAELFTDEYRASLAMFVAPVAKAGHAIEELVGALLGDLLVGGEAGPKLAAYAGRGPLRAWLRMVSVRRSLNEARDGTRHARLEHRVFTETVSATADPEIALIKQRYGAEFQRAFRDAMTGLPAAERGLLRLHYGQELPLADLAAMHGWSKPTASRRVAAARALLLEGTCALLRERLHLEPAELESLFRVVRSQLDVSLGGLMRTSAPK